MFDGYARGETSWNIVCVRGEVGARVLDHDRVVGHRPGLLIPACFKLLARVPRRTSSPR